MEIVDPILGKDLTRDTCIYGALAKSMEACREAKEQKIKLQDITAELKQVRVLLDNISKGQSKQNSAFKALIIEINKQTAHVKSHFNYVIMMLILILATGIVMLLFEC